MRRRLLLANWKLHHTVAQALAYAQALRAHWPEGRVPHAGLDVGIAPPATALAPMAQALAGSQVALAAQALFAEDDGAYTGALSGPLLAEAGAQYVLVGHSERRHYFHEGDAQVAAQLRAAQRAGLCPVVCVGEEAGAFARGQSLQVVCGQLDAALETVADGPLVVAYEPVWAIGNGHGASARQVAPIMAALRGRLRARLGAAGAAQARLLYGGSVKHETLDETLAVAEVDGVLVGNASLTAASFAELIDRAAH